MSAPPTDCILEFDGAGLAAGVGSEVVYEDLDLRIEAGERVFVKVPRGRADLPLAEAAVGLLPPLQGRVRFQGRDWREIPGLEAAARRQSIGRVYAEAEWVSNLNVDENVILPSCHHTRRPESQIVEEALALARTFGLSTLTSRRPDLVHHDELRAYALVRAFLGGPKLLILERPLRGVVDALLEPLIRTVKAASESGAGVLWMTPETAVLDSGEFQADARYVLEPGGLRPMSGDRS